MEYYRDFAKTLSARLAERLNFIQVVIGPRQVGKTTGIKQIMETWKGPRVYQAADLPVPPSPVWIQEQWDKARAFGEDTLLVLDEVQKISRWSEVVKQNFDADRKKRRLKVVLLGSASLSIQEGLSESLAGRYEVIRTPHWNYYECNKAFGWNFDQFLQFGGYPGAAELIQDLSRWQSFMRDSIIEPVLSRDIMSMRTVSKPALFRQTFELAVSYPAQEISFQKLLGQLQSSGNATTVKGYLELLEAAFMLKLLYKFSSRSLTEKSSSPKIIPLAPALIHALRDPSLISKDPVWRGRVIEAAVGAALAQVSGTLYYWRDGNDEIDYVIKQDDQIIGIEVKSGGSKSGRGIEAFKRKFPKAKTLIMDREMAELFLADQQPENFIKRIV